MEADYMRCMLVRKVYVHVHDMNNAIVVIVVVVVTDMLRGPVL